MGGRRLARSARSRHRAHAPRKGWGGGGGAHRAAGTCAARGVAMAERLAQLHGTEKDKVNCPFYHKIGACRHGDRCSRLHNKPEVSRTLLLPHLFQAALTNTAVPATQGAQESFERREEQEFFGASAGARLRPALRARSASADGANVGAARRMCRTARTRARARAYAPLTWRQGRQDEC